MKRGLNLNNFCKAVLLTGAMLLASSAFAASNKGTITLHHPAVVGGHELAPGMYDVVWSGSGEDVQLNLLLNGRSVASTNARVVPVEKTVKTDNAMLSTKSDGTMALTQIQLRRRKFALEITDAGGAAGAAGAAR